MKRTLRWTGLILAALILLILLASAAMLSTPLGTWTVSRLVFPVLPAGLTVEGLQGRLGGHLEVERVSLVADGLVLEVRDITVRYAPWGLVLPPRTLRVDELQVASVTVEQTERRSPVTPSGERNLPLEAPSLPLAVLLTSLSVDQLEVTTTSDWTAQVRDIVASGHLDADAAVIESLRLQGLLASPEDVDLSAEFSASARASWPTDRRASADLRLELESDLDGLPHLSLGLELDGALGDQPSLTLTSARPLAGSLQVQVAGLDGSEPLRGDARLEIPSALDLAALDERLPPVTVSGGAAAQLGASALTLQPSLTIGLDAFSAIARGRKQALLDGELSLALADNPPLVVNAQPLRVRLGNAQGASGTIELRGSASAERSIDMKVSVDELNPGWLAPQWQGRVSGEATLAVQQTVGRPLPSVRLEGLSAQGVLRDQAVAVRGSATLAEDGRLQIEDFTARSGGASLSADGALTLSAGTSLLPKAAQLKTTLDVPALEEVLPDASGSLALEATLSGDLDKPVIDATVKGMDLSMAGTFSLDSIVADIAVDGRDDLAADVLARGLRVSSVALDRVVIGAEGSVAAHEVTLAITNPDVALRSTLAGGADLDAASWLGSLSAFSLSALDREWRLTETAPGPDQQAASSRIALSATEQSLPPLCLAAPPHPDRLCLSGRRAGPTLDGELTLSSVALQPWSSLLGLPVRVQASLEGSVELRSVADDLPSLSAAITLSPGQLSLTSAKGTSEELQALRWQEVSFVLDTQEEALVASAEADLTDAGRLEARARAPRALLGGGVDLKAQEIDADLNGRLQVPARLANAIPGLSALTGTATVDLAAHGALGAPLLSGELQVQGLEADIALAGVQVRDGTLSLSAEADDLRLTASASTGEGTLRTEARFRQSDGGWLGELTLDGERVLVMDTPEIRALISPSLRSQVDVAARSVQLQGTVAVPEAQLRPIDLANAVRTSNDEIIVGQSMAEVETGWRTDADVTLRLGDAVSYRGGGFRGNLRGELAVRERTGEISTGTGELSVADASFSAFGQTLEVNRGRVVFIRSPLTNPGLDVQASRTVEDVTVRVDIRGTLRDQIITLSSTPALPQADALSYLVIGKPLSELQGGDSELLSTAARKTGLAGADLLARRVGRRIGLDEFSVESDDGGANAQLVVGKYLSPKLYVRYGLGLFETLNTWLLRYDLSRRWAVETETGAQNSIDVLYSIEN